MCGYLLVRSMGLHVNPLKKRKILFLNSGKPTEGEVPMSWQDAVTVALVITLAQIFTAFLTVYDWSKITNDPTVFLFDLFKFAGASFFTTFIALTGLSRLYGD